MSLNGLDDSKVQEAFIAVSAEPGGWLLLKYASRDEVELLSQGTGGITDIRTAIEGYEENSALYGFLKYRRRNVIIKYLPEDASRLVQARVAVHFTAVCERFTPNDTGTTFEITKAEELRDSKLSAACSLHAASNSNTPSTSSLRRRRLGEIAEEDEEEQRETKRRSLTTTDEDDKASSAAPRSSINDDPVRLNSELASSPEQTKFSNSSTSELPNFVGSDGRPPSPSASVTSGRRMSSQTTRTELFSNYSSYGYSKPKVKLGPRPTFDPNRPQTAGNFKPVSSIPAGLKLFGKGGSAKKGRRDSVSSGKDDSGIAMSISSPDGAQSAIEFSPPPATPFSAEEVVRPNTSSGVSTASTVVAAKPAMSREKARLKKAMQLREKKKKMSMLSMQGLEIAPEEELPPAEEGDTEPAEKKVPETTDVEGDEASEVDEKRVTMLKVEKRVTVIKAGSADDVENPVVHADQGSEIETTGRESLSRPGSPVPASSEADESTKASSVSEGTEETIQKPSDNPAEESVSPENNTEQPGDEATLAEGAAQSKEEDMPSAQVLRMSQDPERMLLKPLTYVPPAKESPITEDSPSQAPEGPAEAKSPIVKEQAVEAPSTANDAPVSGEVSAPYAQDATLAILESKPVETTPEEVEVTSSETIDAPAPVTSQDNAAAVSTIAAPIAEESEQDKVKAKRRGFPEPIRTDLASRHSRHASITSTEDAFLDELQSAEVQEAKPMYVTKTPVTPVFPKEATSPQPPPMPIDPNTEFFKPQVVRTTSNPLRGGLVAPTDVSQSSARSVSMGAAYLHKVTQQQNNGNLSKKGGKMGSGITQRIKALEMLSAKAETEGQSGSRPSSAFFSVNKSREPSRSPSLVDRTNSFKKQTPEPADQLRNPSPETLARRRERTGSVVSRMSIFESPPSADTRAYDYPPQQMQRGRPESVSVTARIVRDPNNVSDLRSDGMELRQSPLQVDHHAAIPADEDYPRRMSRESRRSASQDGSNAKSRRSSLSVVKDFIKDRRAPANAPNGPRSPVSTSQMAGNPGSIAHRVSISRDRDAFSSITEGSISSDDTKSMSEKKTSRTTRFMRRLSTLSSKNKAGGNSPGVSPPLTEEPEPSFHPMLSSLAQRPATTAGTPSITHQLGAANVQFPDTLLWKRRDLSLDSAGYLILAPLPGAAQSGKILGQSTKRFHMSMFIRPYIPDVEVQELPNSVVLDFKGGEGEGEGVKIAWEDRGGQMKFLQILEDAHASHTSRFGL